MWTFNVQLWPSQQAQQIFYVNFMSILCRTWQKAPKNAHFDKQKGQLGFDLTGLFIILTSSGGGI